MRHSELFSRALFVIGLLLLAFSQQSCVSVDPLPMYDKEALAQCLLSPDTSMPLQLLGKPTKKDRTNRGKIVLQWRRHSKVLKRTPMYIDTYGNNDSIGYLDTFGNINLNGTFNSRTVIYGGEICEVDRYCAVDFVESPRTKRPEAFAYVRGGGDRVYVSSSNFPLWRIDLYHYAAIDKLKDFKKLLAATPTPFRTEEEYTRLAVIAARRGSKNVASWLVQQYNLDGDRKVRICSYVENRGICRGYVEYKSIRDFWPAFEELKKHRPRHR